MDLTLQQMSLPEYAELQQRLGVKIIYRNGTYWRRVRAFFYRPLLPVEEVAPLASPPVSWPNSFQYVIANGQPANSTMNFLMLDGLPEYSLNSLNHKRRSLIKKAAQQFAIRPLLETNEIKQHGHDIYLSFLQRTGYAYKSDRKNRAVFDQWVDTLFENKKAILLGGYGADGLEAIFSGYWVNHYLVYATVICATEALKKNIGELMFHEVRLLAAQQPAIREIFVRSYQGGNSLDEYYLHRDCRLVRKPACLATPPMVQGLMRWVMPRKYAALHGEIKNHG